MKTLIRYIAIFISIVTLSQCTWESDDLTEVYDIIHVRRNGADMPAHIHGNAASKTFIVVLHGGPGGNGLTYRPGCFSEILEEEYAMVYFDQRGQGMAQGNFGSEDVEVQDMVLDVADLTTILKHKYGDEISLFLLGHSWGGTLGTAYLQTADLQSEYKGWIEVDGAHDFTLMLRSQIRLFESIIREQLADGNSKDFWEETEDKINEIDTSKVELDDVITLNQLAYEAEARLLQDSVVRQGFLDFINIPVTAKSLMFSENPITSYVSGLATNYVMTQQHDLFTSNYSDELGKITIPSLLIWGKYDLVVPPALGEQALEMLGSDHKELHILERSGHSPMLNEGGTFSNLVIDFVDTFR